MLIYSTKERTSLLHINEQYGFVVWLNGEVVVDPGMKLGLKRFRDATVPVILREGRNSVVVFSSNPGVSLHLRFDDSPEERGAVLAQLGLWDEAESAWDKAEDQGSLSIEAVLRRPWLPAARGDASKYRRACDRMTGLAQSYNVFAAMGLGARSDAGFDLERLVELGKSVERKYPIMEGWASIGTLLAAYRNGEYARVLELVKKYEKSSKENFSGVLPIVAMAQQKLGKVEEARRSLEQYPDASAAALRRQSEGYAPFDENWYDSALSITIRREAKSMIEGSANDPSADIGPVLANARDIYQSLDPRTSAYEIAVMLEPQNALYRKALDERWAKLGLIDQAVDRFIKRIDMIPIARVNWSTRSRELVAFSNSSKAFARLVELRPDDDSLWSARARNHALRGQWKEAAANFSRSVRSAPIDSEEYAELAYTRLLAGDESGSRSAILEMIEKWEGSEDTSAAFVLARTASVSPRPGVEVGRIVNWAEKAVSLGRYAWRLHVLALARYRAGDFAGALTALQEAETTNWPGGVEQNKLLRAMITYRMNEPDSSLQRSKAVNLLQEVRNTVRNAKALAIDGMVDKQTSDWLPLLVLLPEAEALMLYDPIFPANSFAN